MSEITEATQNFINEVKKSETYKRYQRAKSKMLAVPGLKEQIEEYRKKTYELQTYSNSGELFDRIDAFETEYESFWDDPIVSDFLDTELALCRMMQETSLMIVEEIQFE